MSDLATLSEGFSGIHVRPRLPYRQVFISPRALDALQAAQALLGDDIKLVVTRGFENSGTALRVLHKVGRVLGGMFFIFVYPWRIPEVKEIFSPNGHDVDGTHVDVSVIVNGTLKRLLPFGVFTSRRQTAKIQISEEAWLAEVYRALQQCGFKIHPNVTESLQIHCDLI